MRRVIALSISAAVASAIATACVVGGTSFLEGKAAAQDTVSQENSASATAGDPNATTTAASAPAPEEGPVAAPSAPPDIDAGTYAVRLRDLEQRINALKEQIFQSKARLSLLAETVLQGVVAGAQAVVVHENRMSSSYRLVKAVYALDGARIFSKADEEGGLGEQNEFEIYNGSIVPGEHNVTVNLEYRGHGYGIFSYLKGYRFRVRSSYSFTAPEGKAITLRIVGYEKGGPTAPLEERPAVRYLERIESTQRGEAPEPAAAQNSSASQNSSSSQGAAGAQ